MNAFLNHRTRRASRRVGDGRLAPGCTRRSWKASLHPTSRAAACIPAACPSNVHAARLLSARHLFLSCGKRPACVFFRTVVFHSRRHDMMPIALLCNSSAMGVFESYPAVGQTQQVSTIRIEKRCRNADMHKCIDAEMQ